MRLANINDLESCMAILEDAKAFLKLNGSLQWQQGYPREENLINDINSNSLYVLEEDGIIKGMVALKQEYTKNYETIFDGKWDYQPSNDDLVIHRIAVKAEYRGKGIGKRIMQFAIDYAKNSGIRHLKTDTHILNIPMQKITESVGFKKMGTVISMLEEKDHFRIAYELNLEC